MGIPGGPHTCCGKAFSASIRTWLASHPHMNQDPDLSARPMHVCDGLFVEEECGGSG